MMSPSILILVQFARNPLLALESSVLKTIVSMFPELSIVPGMDLPQVLTISLSSESKTEMFSSYKMYWQTLRMLSLTLKEVKLTTKMIFNLKIHNHNCDSWVFFHFNMINIFMWIRIKVRIVWRWYLAWVSSY